VTALFHSDDQVTLWLGDALDVLRELPGASVDCIVTSPPYYKARDYKIAGQYGQEASPAEFVSKLRDVFAEARRVLAADGTCWINIDDSYANKSALLVPERLLISLADDGWIVRNKGVWHKRNAMPEKAQDRLSHKWEHLFLLTRQGRYHFDLDAIRNPITEERAQHDRNAALNRHVYAAPGTNHGTGPTTLHRTANPLGSNPGDVWDIPKRPGRHAGKHYATFPIDLPLRAIKAGCRPGGVVLDPFSGTGTTGLAARQLGMRYVGIDLNAADHAVARGDLTVADMFDQATA
jgi:site-specific DNA-methyltransferase (cytosine-N4-specific)